MKRTHRRVHLRFWLIVGPLIILALVLVLTLRPQMSASALLSTEPFASVITTPSYLAS